MSDDSYMWDDEIESDGDEDTAPEDLPGDNSETATTPAVEDSNADDAPTSESDDAVATINDPPAPSRWVRLADLVLEYKHWKNPRSHTGLDAESLAELKNSIAENTSAPLGDEGSEAAPQAGIRTPLEVVMVQAGNGNVLTLVIDGQRRYYAAEQLGIPDLLVPVIDLESEPVELTPELAAKYLSMALDTVATRAPLSSFELAESAARLRDSRNEATGRDYTLAEISRIVHRSESWVSRFLKAMANATPVLLHKWRRGELTDEQFKDLATARDPEEQAAKATEVAEARKSGDRAEARTLAKEQSEGAKARSKAAKPSATPTAIKGSAKTPASSKGEQLEIPPTPPKKPPAHAIIEDILNLAIDNPPTHEYVKGIMDALRYARGHMDSAAFAKPWGTYLQHVQAMKGKTDATDASAKSKPSKGTGKKRRK